MLDLNLYVHDDRPLEFPRKIVVCKCANLIYWKSALQCRSQKTNRKFWNLVRHQVYHWKGKITKCILKLSLIHNWLSYMHNLLRYSAYMILSEKAIESYVWIIMAIHIIHDLTVELKFTVLLKYSWVLMSNLSYSFSKNICQTVIIENSIWIIMISWLCLYSQFSLSTDGFWCQIFHNIFQNIYVNVFLK